MKFHSASNPVDLDAHHIVARDLMLNGGYVASNGITVCDECHIKCEQYWKTDLAVEGFAIQDLFNLIGSSGEQARIDSEKL